MTMRKSIISLCVLCLSGCVPSLHELYTADTLVYDPAIVGTWQQDDERWQFKGDPNDRSYDLMITKKQEIPSKLIGHLVEIERQRFLDLYPSDDTKLETGDWIKFQLVPAHLFLSIKKENDMLVMTAMDPDAIRKMLEKRPDWIKHEVIKDDRVVLTAQPKQLQKFLLEGLKTEGFFGKATEFTPVQE